MKRWTLCIAAVWALMVGSAHAEIYRYVDERGQPHYADDLAKIPADKRSTVTVHESYESDPAASVQPTFPVRPAPVVMPTTKPSQVEKRRQKENLMAEYHALLQEKQALDNDKGFQKRRKKRKYKNRAYIKVLVEKETHLIERIADIEAKLKAFGN